jgi:D-alanyl-D-alanine carboxypeptidase
MGSKQGWLGALALGAAVAMAVTFVRANAEDERAAPAPPPAKAMVDVGIVVEDRTTGTDLRADDQDHAFRSASVIKLLIALDALERGESAELVTHMLSTSDDGEANRLWEAGGSWDVVTKWAGRLGLSGTRAPENPDQWGDTRTTARDIAAVYRYLFDHHPDGDTVLSALHAMADHGSDGFDQRFGIPTAAGDRPWGAKQGWACCEGERTLHTTGVVGRGDRYIVVVLTSYPVETTWESASTQVTQLVTKLLTTL